MATHLMNQVELLLARVQNLVEVTQNVCIEKKYQFVNFRELEVCVLGIFFSRNKYIQRNHILSGNCE